MSEKPEALLVADRLDLWGDQGDLLEAAAELRRLHAECDALRADRAAAIARAEEAEKRAWRAEIDLTATEAECDALRSDAERYRWLRDQKVDDGCVIAMKNKHIDDAVSYAENIDRYIDAAIDAARARSAK